MKTWKKIASSALACLTAGALALTTAACSSSTASAWVAQNDNVTVSEGVYNYYLVAAYNNASRMVSDYFSPVLTQEIDGMTGEEWVRERALQYVKSLMLVEDMMQEYGLSLTDEERYTSEQEAAYEWQTYQEMFEAYNVDQDALREAYTDYQTKVMKVFQHMYSEGGERAVPEEELRDHYIQNYTSFHYIFQSTYNDDYSSMSDEQLAELKTRFDGYAADISSGATTMEEAAQDYVDYLNSEKAAAETSSTSSEAETTATTEATLESVYQNRSLNLNSDDTNVSGYPEELITAVQEMEAGEVRMIEATGYYIVVMKDDINTQADTQLSTDDGKLPILIDLKSDEFMTYLDEQTAEYTNFTLNEAIYNKDLTPLLEPSAASSTSSETEASASSSTADTSAGSSAASSGTETTASGTQSDTSTASSDAAADSADTASSAASAASGTASGSTSSAA